VISAELAAWNLAVKRHVKSHWIMPPEFRESGLAAQLAIWVQASGAIRGQPQLLRTSGNPYYDDNAIRALSRSTPLPPPPAPGRRVLILSAEE
jgi:outer membrane biosynthesis protein TonB